MGGLNVMADQWLFDYLFKWAFFIYLLNLDVGLIMQKKKKVILKFLSLTYKSFLF